MEEYEHKTSFCKGNTQESSELFYDEKQGHQNFKIENITVIKPPLLKTFYWQSLKIDDLNDKLLTTQDNHITHNMYLPTRQLNSKPLKIIFWLRNLSKDVIKLQLKRIKNCQCLPMETRVGFNQFRQLYRCPHRRLINISQELLRMEPNDLVAFTIVAYYYIIGEYVLSYELSVSDSRVILLNFHLDITTFDPVKSVLTTELLPINIKEHRRLAQPIWIRNITMQNLQFLFMSQDRGLRLINPNLVVPRQSVWPLIVEYRPSDFENDLELILNFDDGMQCGGGMRHKISLTCKGYLEEQCNNNDAPLNDYECSDFLYVIYPNKLVFNSELNEDRTLMVAVHNYDQKCMEFKWQTYTISDYFSFTFEPPIFTLKPHHSKLCVVRVRTFETPLHFKCIPAVLEVHRILDKSTQIAKDLLTEVESIDDPKWNIDSYVEHVLLHIDLKVNFPKLKRESDETKPIRSSNHSNATTTIFEKLFWEYLSESDYMRNTIKISRSLSYDELLQRDTTQKEIKETIVDIDKKGALNILSYITAEACRDLSKNYRFVPPEILDNF